MNHFNLAKKIAETSKGKRVDGNANRLAYFISGR